MKALSTPLHEIRAVRLKLCSEEADLLELTVGRAPSLGLWNEKSQWNWASRIG